MGNVLLAALQFAFSVVAWLHAHTARPLVEWWDDTVLGVWEESVKSVVREAFVQTYRFLNGASAWVLSVFDTNYAESLRSSWKQQQDWHSWWAEDRQSTLNAVVTKYVPNTPPPQQQHSRSSSGPLAGKPQVDGASTSTATGTAAADGSQPEQLQHPTPAFGPRRSSGSVWYRAGSFVSGSLLGRRSGSMATALDTPVHISAEQMRAPLGPDGGRGQHAGVAPVSTRQIAKARMPFHKSVVFEQPAGWGVNEGVKRTGLLEDLRLMAELCVTRVFDAMRMIVRAVTFTPKASSPLQRAQMRRSRRFPSRSKSAGAALYAQGLEHGSMHSSSSLEEPPSPGPQQPQLRRVHSSSGWEGPAAVPAMAEELSSAAQIIKLAGYPLELHEVVTDDGYILSMERIPRRGSRDVVFFMHGILDTSLTWVSSGVTGSQAFAAWDQGFDVWLGNSRSNPPRTATDPSRQGVHYWHYTNNELGIYDMSSQIDHIHETKCRELIRSFDSNIDLAPLLDTGGRPSSAAIINHGSSGVLPLGTSAEKLFASGGAATAAAAGNGSGGVGSLPLPRLKTSVSDSRLENLDERALGGVEAPLRAGSSMLGIVNGGVADRSAAALALNGAGAGFGGGAGSAEGVGPPVGAVNALAGALADGVAPSGERFESGGSGGSGMRSGSRGVGALGSGPLADVSEQAGENWEEEGSRRASVGALVASAASAATRLFGSRGSRGSGGDVLLLEEQEEQEEQQQGESGLAGVHSRSGKVSGSEMQQEQQQGQEQQKARSRLQLFGWGSGSSINDSAAKGGSASNSASVSGGSPAAGPAAAAVGSGAASPNACQPSTPQAMDSPFRLANDMSSPPASALRPGVNGSAGGRRSSGDSSNGSSRGSNSGAGSAAGSPRAAYTDSSGGVYESANSGSGSGNGSEAASAASTSPRSSRSGSIGAIAGAVAAMFGSGTRRQQQQQQGTDAPQEAQPQEQHSPEHGARLPSGGATGSGSGTATASAAEALQLAVADSAERAALDAMPLGSTITPPLSRASSGRLGHQQSTPRQHQHDYGHPGFSHHQSPEPQQQQGGGQGQRSSPPAAAATAVAPGAARMAAASNARAADAAAADARLLDAQFTMRRSQSSQAVFSLDADADAAPRHARVTDINGVNGVSGVGGVRAGSVHPTSLSHSHNRPWVASGSATRSPQEPYNLRVVAHSLGGASMLMYLVMRYKAAQPHHVRRLVLLTPAGYHSTLPWALRLVALTLPYAMRAARMVWRGAGGALYIPTFIARLLTFKIGLDANRLPALAELLRQTAQGVLGGDRSAWERALQQPHYNARAMPAVSLHQGLHLAQWVKTGAFTLYNYGSRAANMAHYGLPFPPDVGEEYWRIDIPVDISAGIHDGIIPVANARKHYSHMRGAGVRVTYREFDYGHMDFTFSAKDELRYYVMGRLLRRS